MADFPKEFPPVVSKNLATFDFNDLASGIAYANFFWWSARNEADEFTDILISQDLGSQTRTISNGATEIISSSPFLLTRIMEGSAYVNFTENFPAVDDFATLSLFHVAKDTTETQLGSDWDTADNAADQQAVFEVPRTIFGAGDILRLKLLAVNGSVITSDLVISVPFNIS